VLAGQNVDGSHGIGSSHDPLLAGGERGPAAGWRIA
jgi:hypothetical protein